jgi:hypothetical protein
MKNDTMIEDLRAFAVSLRNNDMPRTGEVLEAAVNEIERTRQLCRKLINEAPYKSAVELTPDQRRWLLDD